MKLNYKRTFLVGLAFFSICAFWQMYDGIIPLILRDTYGLDNKLRGIVMGIDNMLALFLLPLFGALSDKKGRRMPFIVIGTALAVVLTMLLAYIIRHYNAAAPTESLMIFFVSLMALLVSMGFTAPLPLRSWRTLRPSPCAARATP